MAGQELQEKIPFNKTSVDVLLAFFLRVFFRHPTIFYLHTHHVCFHHFHHFRVSHHFLHFGLIKFSVRLEKSGAPRDISF